MPGSISLPNGSITTGLDTVTYTTVITTNLQVSNIKALDGTAAGSIANSTGIVTLASTVLTTTDINGGTIDGTVIGGSAAAAGTFTTTTTGNLTLTSSTIPTNGLYLPAANTVGIATDGVLRVSVSTTAVLSTLPITIASDLTLATGSITSASGAISFGNENLTTTGTLASGALTITDTANETAISVTSSVTNGGPAFNFVANSLTSETGLRVEVSALTTGTGLAVTSNSADTSARSLVFIRNDNTAATGAYPLYLQQDAANAFMNLVGTAAANTTDPISTLTTPGAIVGFEQVDVNGTKRWRALYADPS